jgi:hypothetical protein
MINAGKSALLLSLVIPALAIALAVILWPPPPAALALLAAVWSLSTAVAALQLVELRRRARAATEFAALSTAHGLSGEELLERRLRALGEQERRLQLRELRLARRMRVHHLAGDETHLDLLDPHPADAELADLSALDRQLIRVIEQESQLAFDRVLANRYAAETGIDTALILNDIGAFVGRVARLYQPGADRPLLETDIELVAKSASSTALHLLVVIDDLPIDLKTYSVSKVYALIRKAASYYGTYKAVQPYLDYGLSALQVARLALGTNPVTVGVTWLAGKLTSQGAKVVTERVLHQQALQLLHDFVRVIGFEAAMVYGGAFRHRDVNWVLGAELVNLEISRGDDLRGRDAALRDLSRLALRHEFDRVKLLRHLGQGKPLDITAVRPAVVLTQLERESVVEHLATHCAASRVDLDSPMVSRWREAAESQLDMVIPMRESSPRRSRLDHVRQRLDRLGNPVDKIQGILRRRAPPASSERSCPQEVPPANSPGDSGLYSDAAESPTPSDSGNRERQD